MKFTDGFWQTRPGVTALYAQEAYDIERVGESVRVTAPTRVIARRGDTLNRPALTVSLSSPLAGVIAVRVENHLGSAHHRGFEMPGADAAATEIRIDDVGGSLTSGSLTARIAAGSPWSLEFESNGRVLTRSGGKSIGRMDLAPDAAVAAEPVGEVGASADGRPAASRYLHAQLSLGVGELVYGLGERFGPLVKNGQSVDVWNADGGTSSEQSYKSVPFYLTNRGYGVLVNHSEHVSFEVGSEAVEQVQFSVPGEVLEYLVIDGPTPADVIERYTRLTGRPAEVPAWSYGLWLSTSFTTDYDEKTVSSFIDGMIERDLPLSVFHFDCFWMREFNWTDFAWDTRVFPDPDGMLERLHGKDLRVSVWMNPYIAQRGAAFEEAAAGDYLVKKPNGDIWQWDMWQAGMALVDFTNPDAVTWYQGKIRALLEQGVDAIKTDFGERIPTDVVWHDGTDPAAMHNLYTQLYNKAVFDVLEEYRGKGEAVLFARSATAGGQQMPVHWGGDNSSSFESMAETLRGGLSLALSGFGFWSHDIGGFEGMPDADVFKRWVAFGLLSSHSRLHGSTSYRVPWLFDDGTEEPGQSAVDVTRTFAQLKNRLMPYLLQVGREAHETGLPFMRPMQVEFAGDPSVDHLDRQYMIGSQMLVAPVFSAAGEVQYYLPAGRWTNFFTNETVDGGAWRAETHAFDSIPLWIREGSVIPLGARSDRPDYDYLDGLTLAVYPTQDAGGRDVTITTPDGGAAVFHASWSDSGVQVTSDAEGTWTWRNAAE
ncbi:alpha-xylosidase [Paramicrobacterium agarici]|uniref:alpha-D-xyloside xylohydrolase n=1 Tax=Paramicrobacterium agarici TaxID=630514 RepID=A0A2A9DUS9_9MICO|nr:alpha-xylosidase [Microbacterium agarici]PFG30537.1 alpha-D-xyloside xylohydrolase [Microbacterium agarici]